MKKITPIFLGFVLYGLNVYSPLPAQEKTTFTTSDNLAGNIVYSIYEDYSKQLVLFGTSGGLSIYDGAIKPKFYPKDSPLQNKITTILQDSKGYYWIGTDQGIYMFDEQFRQQAPHANMPPGIQLYEITCLFLDSNNNLWIGTKGAGVTKWTNDEKWVTYYNTGDSSLISNEIMAINEDKRGNLWFGSLNYGICKFDGGSKWTFFQEIEFVGNKINVIFKDQNDTLWVGSNKGVAKTYDGSQWSRFAITCTGDEPAVHTIAEDSELNLWFSVESGPKNDILYKYDRISCQESPIQLDNAPTILATIRDHRGYLWFGTNRFGVTRLHLNWQIFVEGDEVHDLKDDNITSIDEDSNGNIWVATKRKGIAKYDEAVFEKFDVQNNVYGSNFVNSILVVNDDSIWCGTQYGAYSFDGNSNWTPYIDSLPNEKVKTIIQDKNWNLWFGTRGGVSRFDGRNWTTIDTSDGLPAMIVTSLFEDGSGNIWIGTYKGGVCKFGKDSIDTVYDTTNGLIDNYVTAITQDKYFAYWFGTSKGISRLDGSNWEHFTSFNTNMANDSITSLFRDSNDNIWIGNYAGEVYKYDGSFWWDFSDNFLGKDINAIFQNEKKNFWFGTDSGLVKYTPDKSPPQTVIERTPGSIIGVGSTLFTFIGIDTETSTEDLVYSWNLSNILFKKNPIWSEFIHETYTEVIFPSNGTFIFSVKAKDAEGNVGQTDSAIVIVDVTPPTTIINYPVRDAVITGRVNIKGSAFDNSPIKDFKQYSLHHAEGKTIDDITETSWIPIDTLYSPVIDSILSDWDTGMLHGYYFLKLLAEDSLGHNSEFTVRVNIVENLQTIPGEIGGEMQSYENRIKLVLPSGALKKDTITVYYDPVKVSELILPQLDKIQYSQMGYIIGPLNKRLNKPATLSFYYTEDDIYDFEESKLSLARLVSSDSIEILGGIIDLKNKMITTTIMELDTFLLVEDKIEKEGSKTIQEFNCQPRIFSPQGGLHLETTTISFRLDNDSKISLKIYNLAGRLIRILKNNSTMRAGYNPIEWDGRDYNGEICPSDLYIVTIKNEKEVKTKTVMILDKS